MSFVWCEWLCGQCGELHRARFDLIVGLEAAYQLKGRIFEREGIYIEDVAFSLKEQPSKKQRKGHGSRIYVKWNTHIDKIFCALREYMPKFYSIKPNTLKMEICRP